jgi:tRNA U55 pseudouridine synthase TruB
VIESANDAAGYLKPIEEAVAHLPKFTLSAERVEKTLNGLPTSSNSHEFSDLEYVQMVDGNDRLIAVGVFQEQHSRVKPAIVMS